MKKILALLLSLILLVSVNINSTARNYNYPYNTNEIELAYSQATIPQFAYLAGGVLGVAFTLGHFTFENTVMTGALGVEYYKTLNPILKVGVVACGEYMTSDAYTTNSDGEKVYNGKFNFGYCSLMPAVKLMWFDNYHFGMYSKIAGGPALAFGDDDPTVSVAAQVSPICLEFGSQEIRGFAEIGVGMQGVVLLGIKKMF